MSETNAVISGPIFLVAPVGLFLSYIYQVIKCNALQHTAIKLELIKWHNKSLRSDNC